MGRNISDFMHSDNPVLALLVRRQGRGVFSREEEYNFAKKIEEQEKKILTYILEKDKSAVDEYYHSKHNKFSVYLESEEENNVGDESGNSENNEKNKISTTKAKQYTLLEDLIVDYNPAEKTEEIWNFYVKNKNSEHLRGILNVAEENYETKLANKRYGKKGRRRLNAEKNRLLGLKNHWLKLREEFFSANYGLVVSIAKRYQGRGLELTDLIQEGNFGLMKALDKFNYSLGNKFSTYSSWWIKQSITRGIADTGRTIRLPVHVLDELSKYLKAETKYLSQHGKIDQKKIAEEQKIKIDKIRKYLRASTEPLSLSNIIGKDDAGELVDIIKNENSLCPEEEITKKYLTEKIAEVISRLDEREQTIIKLRFGLEDDHNYTLEEVGKVFGLTRERIRQIESRALRRLKIYVNRDILIEFRDDLYNPHELFVRANALYNMKKNGYNTANLFK